jgi:DNA repair protein RadC
MNTRQLELQEPDAKLLYMGRSALSDKDIMSLILAGSDNKSKADKLMTASNFNFDGLSKYCYTDLKAFGLSHLQAIRCIAVIEFAKRMNIHRVDEQIQIRSSADIFTFMSPILSDLDHEEFWAVLLNRANRIIKKVKISQGGISGTVTDIRILFKHAINELACGLVVCHNHPSGNTSPSDADIRITQKIKETGNIMDIQVLDHIIIAKSEHYSFADNGQL